MSESIYSIRSDASNLSSKHSFCLLGEAPTDGGLPRVFVLSRSTISFRSEFCSFDACACALVATTLNMLWEEATGYLRLRSSDFALCTYRTCGWWTFAESIIEVKATGGVYLGLQCLVLVRLFFSFFSSTMSSSSVSSSF